MKREAERNEGRPAKRKPNMADVTQEGPGEREGGQASHTEAEYGRRNTIEAGRKRPGGQPNGSQNETKPQPKPR